MTLGHEKLDVYRLSIGYVAWVYEQAGRLNGVHRAARDQWLRVSQSILLNIAEGNGKNDFDPDSDFDLDKEQPQPIPWAGAFLLILSQLFLGSS